MNQVTITLSARDAWWMRSACFDSAIVWMQLQADAEQGLRPDLDVSACKRLKERALAFAQILKEAGADL